MKRRIYLSLFLSLSLCSAFFTREEGRREREREREWREEQEIKADLPSPLSTKKNKKKTSAPDALAKYLLIGYPKNIGISVPETAPNAYNIQSYESPNFAGLKEYR